MHQQKPQHKAGANFFEVVDSMSRKKTVVRTQLPFKKKAPGMGLGQMTVDSCSTVTLARGSDGANCAEAVRF